MPESRPIGYEIPSTYWCYACAPESVTSDDPIRDDVWLPGFAPYCEKCGAELTPEKWETDV